MKTVAPAQLPQQSFSKTVGRPPVRQREIVSHLRDRIVSGELGPMSRLPTRRELCESYSASAMTVQQAMTQLIQDGFLEAKGTRGTFVAACPPHMTRYALVFPHLPGEAGFNRFWVALANEAVRLTQSGAITVDVRYGVDGHAEREDARKLRSDLRRHRLAGLIFACPPFMLRDTPMLETPDVPRVAIMPPSDMYSNVTALAFDYQSFLSKSLDHMANCGRRRVAVLTSPGGLDDWTEKLGPALAERGLSTRPYWIQAADPAAPKVARNLIHLLMSSREDDRPDGLILADDNLVDHAVAGLVDAGVRIPTDVEVVAHCNFPWPTPSPVAVKRLGYDAREVLGACIAEVDRQRRRAPMVQPPMVRAVWEDELGQ